MLSFLDMEFYVLIIIVFFIALALASLSNDE